MPDRWVTSAAGAAQPGIAARRKATANSVLYMASTSALGDRPLADRRSGDRLLRAELVDSAADRVEQALFERQQLRFDRGQRECGKLDFLRRLRGRGDLGARTEPVPHDR